MQKNRPALTAILMMTAALAGCVGEDTSDLDAQIEDLGSQNTELAQTVAERDVAISDLEATVSGHESNIAGLEAAIALMEEQRDSLLALLSDSQEFANQTIAVADAMNETIVGLHAMLGENATQVLQLQSDLAVQQDLVAQWQQTAEDNLVDLGGADLGNADLSYAWMGGADLSGVNWAYTTCPDGTNSDDNGNTCENNL